METINAGLAMRAYDGISMSPEKRGLQVIQDYHDELTQDYNELLKHAPTDEKKAILEEEFAKYRGGYTTRTNKWLNAKSRCISSFITGPSNFPVRRAEKRNNAERARLEDLLGYRKWALNEIKKKLHPEWRPIMAGDDDAQTRLKAKIEQLEKYQFQMKSINATLRKANKGDFETKKKALMDLGMNEQRALEILKPDYMGRVGIPTWKMSNNTANLRRLKARLESISKNQAKETTQAEGTNAKFEDNPADNRVRIFFPGKPSEEIRTKLKSQGFRWSPTIGAWQAYRHQHTIVTAKEVAGVPA